MSRHGVEPHSTTGFNGPLRGLSPRVLPPRRARRGLTLVEVIVAGAISLVILNVALSLFVPSMRFTIRGTLRSAVQTEALLALEKVSDDLRSATSSGISFLPVDGGTPPVTLAIQKLKDVASDGTQVWSDRLVVYQWNESGGPLSRAIVDPARVGIALDTVTPEPLATADLEKLKSAPREEERILARGVTLFQVAMQVPITASRPVSVTLVVARTGATGRDEAERYEGTRTISLRNGL